MTYTATGTWKAAYKSGNLKQTYYTAHGTVSRQIPHLLLVRISKSVPLCRTRNTEAQAKNRMVAKQAYFTGRVT